MVARSYQVQSSQALLAAHRKLLARGRARQAVGRTVLLLGLTSLFTDISSEMVATILPLYLVFTLVRVASGFAGDRWRRHKTVAAVG